jgi:hypothetical protein
MSIDKDSEKLKRRDILASQVNKEIQVTAIYGGTHLAKGFIEGKTVLLKDVRTQSGQFIDDHLWVPTNDYMRFDQFNRGDKLDILGKVRKYKKLTMTKKMATNFSIDILDVKKDGHGVAVS